MSKPILLYTSDIDAAKAEITAVGGGVTQVFSSRLFEAILPEGLAAKTLRHSSTAPKGEVDETTTLLAKAWQAMGARSKDAKKSLRAAGEEVVKWDDPRFKPPGKIDQPPFRTRGAKGLTAESSGTPTSLRMIGSVAVGLVVVSGTGAGLGFTGAEQITVVQQVMQGLQFLAGAAPLGNLTFVYDIHFLTVNASPPASCPTYEACESVWEDPALAQLGYQAGYAGCVDYANALKQNQKTDWSYVAFFTKYPQKWFAYAGGVRLCMQYSNDGWGPGQIDRVFAHETCHIFGAADEYGSCGCGPSGELNVPNSNCVNCTTSQVACLMNANTFSLCYWSRGQIGWWPKVANSMGAVSVNGTRPYVFVTGMDANLWVDWWSGSTWDWANQGKPPGVSLGASMGALIVDGGRPYVFATASDGNLWVNWWSGSAWAWSNQGKPGGVSLGASMGAVTVDGGRPYVFAKASDGNLWVNWWSGTAWAWANQSKPAGVSLGASMGAVSVDGKRPYVFATASDGNLWVNWWSGSAWAWSNQGKPGGVSLGASMGAVTVDGGRPYVFTTASDGNLWVNWWSGTAWAWANQGKPGGVSLGASMGAVSVDGKRPYVFVMGSDGNMWVNWWSGTAWAWANQGRPSGLSITAAMGATLVDGGRPYVFVKCSDGNLWVNWWTGSAWKWDQQSYS